MGDRYQRNPKVTLAERDTRLDQMKTLAGCNLPEEVDTWMQALVYESHLDFDKNLLWTSDIVDALLVTKPGVIYLLNISDGCCGYEVWFVDLRGELREGEGAVWHAGHLREDVFEHREVWHDGDFITPPLSFWCKVMSSEGALACGEPKESVLTCVAPGLTDFFSSWAVGGHVPGPRTIAGNDYFSL